MVISHKKQNSFRMMGYTNLYPVETDVRFAELKKNIDFLIKLAETQPNTEFYITNTLGSDEEIAPMFAHSPPNCTIPRKWLDISIFSEEHKLWG